MLSVPLIAGCYLSHLAAGQARLLWAREPIDEALTEPDLSPDFRTRLALVPEVRAFAATLGLDVGERYTSYAPWPGDRIVTALVATRPGEIDPHLFWFAFVGSVPYRGYFDPEYAQEDAAELESEGYDVCLSAVPAYSTLGWMDDPVTGPMLQRDDVDLVDTLIHELLHQTVYARNAGRFNEGLATFVGQEGAILFFAQRDGPDAASTRAARASVADDRALSAALERTRARIDALYAATPAGPERDTERAAIEAEARAKIAALPLTTRDAARVAKRVRLGDACLALEGTYTGDLPRYEAALARAGDLPTLIQRAKQAARTQDPRETLLGAP